MTDNNLFSGLRIVSKQEVKTSKEDPSKQEGENSSDEGTSSSKESSLEQGEQSTSKDIDSDSAFSLMTGEDRASVTTPSDEKGDSSEEGDSSVQDRVEDIEEEKDLDLKAKKYLALANELQAEGLISEIGEDFEPNLDGLKDLFSKEKESSVNKEISKFKESFSGAKKVFLDIEEGFDSEVDAINMAKKIDFFSNINPEAIKGNEKLAEKILTESLKLAGFSDERIEEEIDDAKDLGKLEEKASKSLPGINKKYNDVVQKGKEERKARIDAQIKSQKDAFDNMLNQIDKKDHIIEGLPYSKRNKDRLKDKLTKVVHKDDKGVQYTELGYKQSKNPVEFEILINYLDDLGIFNMKGDKFVPDLSKLKNIAKSKATHELDNIIDQEEATNKHKKSKQASNRHSVTDDIIAKLDRARK